MRITILSNLNHDGEEYTPGDYDLPETTAQHLLTMPWVARPAQETAAPAVHEGASDAAHAPSLRLLSVEQARREIAAQLGKTPSRSATYRLIQSGRLAAVTVGNRWYLRPQDLTYYIENAREGIK